jgi:pimeloyl-ACP methyl ester carboxylesterase
MDWNHQIAETPRLNIHYVRHGSGMPLILQHGWPEFWYAFRKNIPVLAENFDVIVPDMRGFNDSDDVEGIPTMQDFSDDMLGLADHLGLEKFGIVSHDVGAWLAMDLGRRVPDRITGLFFFNCSNPGIGGRWAVPEHLIEVWYQSFHRLPLAHELVGHSPETVRIYFRHFLSHWAHDPNAFGEDDLDAWVEAFSKPGRLKSCFKWYESWAETRLKGVTAGPPDLPNVVPPSRVLWGAEDPVNKAIWRDNLGDYFDDVKIETAPDAGHFVHFEKPDLANAEILAFYQGLGLA